jgi:uncharacterized protein (DUF427 family)
MLKAMWNSAILAEAAQTDIVEGNHYFSPESLRKEYFRESQTQSVCRWKSTACYFTIVVDGKENADAAWYYPQPKAAASGIAGKVAFWKGVQIIS